jgi:hypothetical protein
MVHQVEGLMARRLLLNYWLDPDVARRLVPEQFELALVNGFAVAGICLLRLEQMRPHGLPAAVGIASENMAHRVAIRYREGDAWRDGVYIWRRDTDSLLARRLGGLLFPGTFRDAEFRVREGEETLEMEVLTADGAADVRFRAVLGTEWKWSLLFARLNDVEHFFRQADRGFHCAAGGSQLEGVRLHQQRWEMTAVAVAEAHAAYFADQARFPRGTVGFDSAVLLHGVPHYWQALEALPDGVRESGTHEPAGRQP